MFDPAGPAEPQTLPPPPEFLAGSPSTSSRHHELLLRLRYSRSGPSSGLGGRGTIVRCVFPPAKPSLSLPCACSNPWGGGDALHYEADPAAAKPAHGTKRPAAEPSRGSPPSQRRRPASAPSPPKPGRQWGPWAPACVPAGSERFRVEGREYCYGAGGDAEGGRTRVRAVLRDGTLGPCVGRLLPPPRRRQTFQGGCEQAGVRRKAGCR